MASSQDALGTPPSYTVSIALHLPSFHPSGSQCQEGVKVKGLSGGRLAKAMWGNDGISLVAKKYEEPVLSPNVLVWERLLRVA